VFAQFASSKLNSSKSCKSSRPQPRLLHPTTTPKMSSRLPSYHEDARTRPSRSRSPRNHPSHSHRERSPPRHAHHRRKRSLDPTPKDLPFNSRQLTKRDYEAFKPMFALYLDIQKGKILEEMDEVEVKGRWKSFVGKW
jgi:hypothetical protein